MRTHFSRSAFLEGARDILPAVIGIIPFGIVCGVGAISAGASPFAALAMSAIIFSGAAQIIAAQLLAAGAPVAVIILSCFVLGLRFLMYSAAMAPYLKPARQPLAQLDRVSADRPGVRCRRSDASANRRICARMPRTSWAAASRCGSRGSSTTMIGILAGNVIPPSWRSSSRCRSASSRLLAPLLRDRSTVVVVVTAGVAAVVARPDADAPVDDLRRRHRHRAPASLADRVFAR